MRALAQIIQGRIDVKMKISLKYSVPAVKIDFVNVNLTKDNKLFIDPLRIRKGDTELHKKCYEAIEYFINNLLQLAKNKKYGEILKIIENLYERNETRLGYSLNTIYGKSFGENGGKDLVRLLSKSDAIEQGMVEDIYDCIMMVPNIGEDKVSDLITTIIFKDLVKYTQEQCELWKIPMEKIKINKLCWDSDTKDWTEIETELPALKHRPIVFVPKSFVGKEYIFSYEKLYRDVIIPLYKERERRAKDSKFVVHYKNGRTHVLGNALREAYPCTKYVIMDFIKQYASVYREYKRNLIDS